MDTLPCDVLRCVLDTATESNPTPRRVSKAWKRLIDEAISARCDEQLVEMLRACRIRTPRLSMRWRLVYLYGRQCNAVPYMCARCLRSVDAIGECDVCRRELCRRPFPWLQIVAGPGMAASIALLFCKWSGG